MFNLPALRSLSRSAVDRYIAGPGVRDPLPATREITYEALRREFGDKHPTQWPDPRDRWARILRINPLLSRMNHSGHPVPERIDLDAFVADRAAGQLNEDAGGYAWRSWMAGFGWKVDV